MWPFKKQRDELNVEPLIELIKLGVITVIDHAPVFFVLDQIPGGSRTSVFKPSFVMGKPQVKQQADYGHSWRLTSASYQRLLAACEAAEARRIARERAKHPDAIALDNAAAAKLAEVYRQRLAELERKCS